MTCLRRGLRSAKRRECSVNGSAIDSSPRARGHLGPNNIEECQLKGSRWSERSETNACTGLGIAPIEFDGCNSSSG